MRTSVLLLAALLHAATGWSDTEDWSYEDWSEGWQHNAGGAQDVFYAEGPGDTDDAAAGDSTIGAYSVSGGGVTGGVGAAGGQVVTEMPLPTDGPTFAKQPTQIVSAVGHNVTFQCRVQNIGEKEVIWMRSRDLQILSVGAAVFSGDARVSAAQRDATRHDATPHDATRRDRTHNLTIALLRPSDAGKYECQLNTDPKRSLYFNLTVLPVLPQIDIWVTGGGAVHEGGTAVLRCAARLRAQPAGRDAAVTRGLGTGVTRGQQAAATHGDAAATHGVRLALRWYKDGEPVELQRGGGAAARARARRGGDTARSVLRVRGVSRRGAGRYECRAAPRAAAHAHLAVLAAETWSESMQRDAAPVTSSSGRAPPPLPPLPLALPVLPLPLVSLLALALGALAATL